MTHATLYVIDEPALAINRHDRDLRPCDVAIIFNDARSRHDVFANLAALYAFLADLNSADRIKRFFKAFVFLELTLTVALFLTVDGLEYADQFRRLFDAVNLCNVNHVWRCPVELILVDLLGP